MARPAELLHGGERTPEDGAVRLELVGDLGAGERGDGERRGRRDRTGGDGEGEADLREAQRPAGGADAGRGADVVPQRDCDG